MKNQTFLTIMFGINSRDCFYELKRFIELAVNPSEENPLLSKFEVMDAADMNKFFITMKKAESFIKKNGKYC